MAVNEGMVDLTNQEVQVQEKKSFENKPAKVLRFKLNQAFRVKFCSGEVLMRRRHYNALKKKYFRCLDHSGYCPVCVAASKKVQGSKKASETFGANVLVYDLNPDGSPKQPLNAEVYFWAFGSEKFAQLRQIINEWGPIVDIDLTITCTDEDFQKVQIAPCRSCLYNDNPDFKAACDKKIKSDSYPLDKFLCKEISLVEMCTEFGLNVEEYIPAEILHQMTGGGNAAQNAAAASPSQQAPQQNTTPPQQNLQQPVAPAYTPQQPSNENFSDIENLGNLL